jgi:glycerophosphoryl diester phosphodiesterase
MSSTALIPASHLLRVALALAGVGVVFAADPVAIGTPAAPARTYLVAHRGASAYAPEHTAEAYRLALEQGADYVEQDVSLTRDGVLVCSHDPSLERVTDVEALFPDRFTEVTTAGRTTKHWFIEDFTLAEVKRLDAGSWFDPKFQGLKVLTFQEAIDQLKGKAGIFPELKTPGRVRAKGLDPEQAVADILKKNGLIGATVKGRPAVHLQVFEEESLRRLTALLPTVPRTFLIGSAAQVQRWLTPDGLKEVGAFATGVGPAYQIIERDPAVVARAHAAGLTVVPYTFRLKPTTSEYPNATPEMRKLIEQSMAGLPDTPAALTALMRKYTDEYKVDGLFTDNPDLFPRPARAGSL